MIGVGNSLGRFTATLGLDTKDYARGMINAQSMNRVFGQSFTAFVSNPLLGSIGLLKQFGGALLRATSQQLALAESLQRTSQQMGLSEQFLIALDKRMEVAGSNAETAARGMQFFAKAAADLRQSGGPIAELEARTGGLVNRQADLQTQLGQVLDLIQRLPTAYERSAAAASVFGRQGGPELLNAIGGGSAAIREMIKQAQQLGFVAEKTGNDQLAALNTQIGYVGLAIEGLKRSAVTNLVIGLTEGSRGDLNTILEVSEAFQNEIGPAARELGRSLRPLIDELPGAMQATANYLRDFIEGWDYLNSTYSGSWLEALVKLSNQGNIKALDSIGAAAANPSAESIGRAYLRNIVPAPARIPFEFLSNLGGQ